MNYQDIFHTSNWEKATYEEKLAALQALENDYAARQGRPPCTIQPVKLDADKGFIRFGTYSFEDKIIRINKDLLNGSDPEYADICNYLCVRNILHEGRHAYQHHSMSHDIHHDKEEVRKWRENLKIYFRAELDLYRFQPMERDANDFADKEMKKIFKDLERTFGKNRGYKTVVWIIDADKRDAKKIAKKRFGFNFIKKIDQLISHEYNLKMEMEKEVAPKKLPDLSNKSPAGISESFNLQKYGGRSQNETVKSRVRDFISEAVEERKALSEVINRKERDSELER